MGLKSGEKASKLKVKAIEASKEGEGQQAADQARDSEDSIFQSQGSDSESINSQKLQQQEVRETKLREARKILFGDFAIN